MLKIATKRPIVVFDIDGVIIQNPPQSRKAGKYEKPAPTIPDPNFWTKHWQNPESEGHKDMIWLAKTLRDSGTSIIFLTGRPVDHRIETKAALRYHGFSIASLCNSVVTDNTYHSHLVMVESGNYGGSAEFKQFMIESWLTQGADIKFLIEDYKPNAEAVRHLVPVLLYERKR
jgi:hypothetical protein